jgi:predicted nucleic acid-binding Zn ribbon protein
MSDAVRHCIKCGREIGPDESICAVCNRAGMVTPSASQYHGTMAAAIVAGVILMAVAASWALTGVGPYSADVIGVRNAADGVQATVSVSNEGTKPGRAKCQLIAHDAQGRSLQSRSVVSPQVPGGESVTFDELVPGVVDPADVTVACD